MIGVGLDIGNSKISCIVYDIDSKKNIKLLSLISKSTNSIKKGVIVDISKIKNEIEEILYEASKQSQTKIASIKLNIPVVNSLTEFNISLAIVA